MICPQCGESNEPEARFCAGCGSPLFQPAAESVKPASPPPTTSQKRSSMPIIVGGLVVVLLILCCCGLILGGGGGAVAVAYLMPTATFTPTATSKPTNTPTRLPTSTPTRVPTRTPTRTPASAPTRTPLSGTEVGGMKTYSSATHKFSIQYPANWTVKENAGGPSFSGTLIGVIINVTKNAGSESAYHESSQAVLRAITPTDFQIVSRSSRVFNGVPWQYSVITSTYQNTDFKIDLYTHVHTTGTGYTFIGLATAALYNTDTRTFSQMMESFRFLP